MDKSPRENGLEDGYNGKPWGSQMNMDLRLPVDGNLNASPDVSQYQVDQGTLMPVSPRRATSQLFPRPIVKEVPTGLPWPNFSAVAAERGFEVVP